MRITIESTGTGPYATKRSICIDIEGDDHDLPTVMTDFVVPALTGWGFNPTNINDYFCEEADFTDGDDE